jgi:hypothetical protein
MKEVAPIVNLPLMVTGILLGVALICAAVYFANKLFNGDMQDNLTKVVISVFVAVSCLWICDKLLFPFRNLLSEGQSNIMFELIKDLTLTVIGVHFGSQIKKDK